MTTDIVVKAESNKIHVIEAYDGQLITNDLILDAKEIDGNLVSEPGNDILKLVVLNRYSPTPPTMAFVRNFGMKKGAIASSVAHDSHNIIAVGASDIEISNFGSIAQAPDLSINPLFSLLTAMASPWLKSPVYSYSDTSANFPLLSI